MKQQSLFASKPEINIEKLNELIKSSDDKNKEVAFKIIEANEWPLYLNLWQIMDVAMETDWSKLWDQFEDNGIMVFFRFKIYGATFLLTDDSAIVEFTITKGGDTSVVEVFEWGESDVFNNKSMKKIKASLKHILKENNYQIEYLTKL